jgi:hypothetical protein
MKEFSTTTTIKAKPEAIWAILTNAAVYPEWDPGTDGIEGNIALGEKLTVYTKLSPGRAFPARVTEFIPGRRMTWTGGKPLGLLVGRRSFILTPREDGITEFTLHEVFTGPLPRLLGRFLPDMTPSFEEFAAGLKSRAENPR